MKTTEEYLKKPERCPTCNGTEVTWGKFNNDSEPTRVGNHCRNCGTEWNDVYELIKYRPIKKPKEKLEARWVIAEGNVAYDQITTRPATLEEALLGKNVFIELHRWDYGANSWVWMGDFDDTKDLISHTGICNVKVAE